MIMISNFIFSFLASLGFAGIFNIKGKKLIYASLGGSIAWLSYLICKNSNCSTVFSFFIGSIAGSIYSEVMARIEKNSCDLNGNMCHDPLSSWWWYVLHHAKGY